MITLPQYNTKDLLAPSQPSPEDLQYRLTAASRGHLLGEVFADGFEEVLRVHVHAVLDVPEAVDAAGEVLGHLAAVHHVDARLLQRLGEPTGEKQVGRKRKKTKII